MSEDQELEAKDMKQSTGESGLYQRLASLTGGE